MLPDIYDLAIRFGYKFKYKSSTIAYAYCHFCDDKSGHMCFDHTKQVWHCSKCDAGGGVINFIQYHCGVDFETAKKMIFSEQYSNMPAIEIQRTATQEIVIASVEERDKVYRALLDRLPLITKHRENLRERGLSDRAITALNFKSTPTRKVEFNIPQNLVSCGYKLNGIPGFFECKGKWAMFCQYSGYFVPFIQDGKIFGMQIRSDANVKKRYKWFSTPRMKGGTQMVSDVHEISFYEGMEKACLTEGGLKADVASYLYHRLSGKVMPFIAIAGVQNRTSLKKELLRLKEKGLKEVIEALDMEKYGNIDVEVNDDVLKAHIAIKHLVEECGLKYSEATWQHKKGIDDTLKYRLDNAQIKKGVHA